MGEQEKEIHCSYPSFSSNHLVAIHGRKCLCGKSGIQAGDCENLEKPKTKKGHFEEADPCLGGKIPTLVPATDSKTAQSLCGVSYSPMCPGSCCQHHSSRDLVDLIIVPDVISAPPNHPFCPFGNLLRDMPNYTSHRPNDLSLTADPEMSCNSAPRPSQAWARTLLPIQGLAGRPTCPCLETGPLT